MQIIPSVRAELAERFIFNFRMSPAVMRRFLPVDWLVPAEVQGYAVASFCMLDLRNITIAPLPTIAGVASLSCAPRYAVIEPSPFEDRTAVFVTERFTNSSFGAWFTSLGFSAPHPYVDAAIDRTEQGVRLSVFQAKRRIFKAHVKTAARHLESSLFTLKTFADFIAQGVSSYGLSIHANRLTRVDLHKNDGTYEPLEVLECVGPAVDEWIAAGAELDSAFRTSGGMYEWTYLGLTP